VSTPVPLPTVSQPAARVGGSGVQALAPARSTPLISAPLNGNNRGHGAGATPPSQNGPSNQDSGLTSSSPGSIGGTGSAGSSLTVPAPFVAPPVVIPTPSFAGGGVLVTPTPQVLGGGSSGGGAGGFAGVPPLQVAADGTHSIGTGWLIAGIVVAVALLVVVAYLLGYVFNYATNQERTPPV
jgi:hypothetical protein